ncbi:ArsR/SmtB family transcription factor [Dethiosulfatarculus sandiegensis]|uniref:ArsR family transcriptional regulator n=1 Tax=Dethiosulfatarculus sandiegensis TaxID=1429043 RepID=A0A0D2JFX7_9BACT|nr:metalloregulator ArsR/SmtB family transcription factor [Dethiosulfatarculus sandiegensis]KIX14596.1 ArsR family transcriptional regulator [Dethiosulfatarculus sandiegensis]
MPRSYEKQLLFNQFANVGKAIGHANRLELLELLAQGERDVETLAKFADLSVANTSHHLQQLRRAGLAVCRQSGQRVIYSLSDDEIVEMFSILRRVAQNNLAEAEKMVREKFTDPDGIEQLTREELLQRIDQGTAVIFDVRPELEYGFGHIKGAQKVPYEGLSQRLHEFSPDEEIVVYCRGQYCQLAYMALKVLRDAGFKARKLKDGFPEWRVAGFPIETGE